MSKVTQKKVTKWYIARGDCTKIAVRDNQGKTIYYNSYQMAQNDRCEGDLILKKELNEVQWQALL